MTALHEWMNVRRVFRRMAAEWKCPVWAVKLTIRKTIDEAWAKAQGDPEVKELWNRYFPDGKPTPSQYILLLGRAKENGETVPYLLN